MIYKKEKKKKAKMEEIVDPKALEVIMWYCYS